jgi:hypothetical protein
VQLFPHRLAHLFAWTVAVTLVACTHSVPNALNNLAMGTFFRPIHIPETGMDSMAAGARRAKILLYVSDFGTKSVYVYNYKTGELLGQLTGFAAPSGQCVDAKGDLWVTDFGGGAPVVEYQHGGAKPIRSLRTNGYTSGCSVAPNGDLAVGNSYSVNQYKIGDVEIWKRASGSPKTYRNTQCPVPSPPGYDDEGNLYVESSSPVGGHANVCELRANGRKLKSISVNEQIGGAGSVQWDGKYLTLTDTGYNGLSATAIYQVREVSGNLVVVGTTVLSDPCDSGFTSVHQPFIVGIANPPVNHTQGVAVVGSNALCRGDVAFWPYTSGGNPTRTLRSAPGQPQGQSVSIRE